MLEGRRDGFCVSDGAREGMTKLVGNLVGALGELDGPGEGFGKGMKVLIWILDGELDGKTLLDGTPEGPLDGEFDLDGPGDGCKEGMIEVVGEAVTGGASSTTVSKIATTLGRSRRKMVSLKIGVNSSGDGAREPIESIGQKHWPESSKKAVSLVSARDRPNCRLKASLNNFVSFGHPRQIPLIRNRNVNFLAMVVLF